MRCQRLCCFGILLAGTGLAAAQQQDFSKVEVHTSRVTGGLYVLQGSGGNMTASVGADGVLLANASFAQGGTIVIAQDNLRTRLKTGGTAGNGGSISREMPAVSTSATAFPSSTSMAAAVCRE